MRAIRFHECGGPDVLQLDEIPKPAPETNTVLIRNEASSVNPLDTLIRKGIKEPPHRPLTIGRDFAGIVEAVGDGVSGFLPGDRVFGSVGPNSEGTHAEYIVVPENRLARLPDATPFEVGAGVAHVGQTAWRALIDHGQLMPADTCLIHGGSGGVGHVGVQIANAISAFVIATASSEDARAQLRDLGADVAFDYRRDDLEKQITESAPDGVDVVIDPFPDEYLDLDINVAAPEAIVCAYGGNEGHFSNAPMARGKRIVIQLMTLNGTSRTPDNEFVLGRLARLLEWGKLDVKIADRYGLENSPEAFRDLADRSFLGKLIIDI